MKTEHIKELKERFTQAKALAGWGDIAQDTLEHLLGVRSGGDITTLFYEQGITPQIAPGLLEDCMAAFQKAHGKNLYNYIAGLGYKPEPFNTFGFNPRNIHSGVSHVIDRILSHAEECLTPFEMHVLFAIDFYDAHKKRSPRSLGEELGYGERTIKQIYSQARKKLIAANPDLERHPALRRRRAFPDPKFANGKIAQDIELECELTAKIFYISSTIFDARHHGLICKEFLRNPEILRDRVRLRRQFNLTEKSYPVTLGFLYRILESALAYEPDQKALLDKLEIFEAERLYKGHTWTKSILLADTLEPENMDLSSPIIRLIYATAFQVGEGLEAPAFCMHSLYRAEHKFSVDEFVDYTPASISRSLDIKPKIVRALHAKGFGFLAEHPIFRQRRLPNALDTQIKELMRESGILERYAQLGEDEKRRWDVASSILNPLQFYSFIRRQFSDPKPSYADIGREVAPLTCAGDVPSSREIAHQGSRVGKLSSDAARLVSSAIGIEDKLSQRAGLPASLTRDRG